MELSLGERHCRGVVIERTQAEARYEEAIEQGDSAFRLQKVGDNLFSASVGNLMAGETAIIRYRYGMVLAWQGESLQIRVPTTVAPRYGESATLEPHQHPEVSLAGEYPLELAVRIYGALAQGTFSSPSHRISVGIGMDCTLVTLAAGATLDRDFVLSIAGQPQHPECWCAPAADGYVAMLSFAPQRPPSDVVVPRSVVVVVDCSGSMGGDSISQAKQALGMILERLRPEDCFDILAFGSSQRAFAGKAIAASRRNLLFARQFVDALDANLGGTELAAALRRAVKTKTSLDPCDVLLITDGEVWLEDDFFEELRASGRRVFTVGVGSAVAEDVVRRIAATTGGACELVSPNDAMAERIARHFSRMFQPRLEALHVTWPSAPSWEAVHADGALFTGDTSTVFAGFQRQPAGEVACDIMVSQGGPLHIATVLGDSDSLGLRPDTLPRLGAYARLAGLAPDEARKLALQYQLVTEQTDYLIVVERAEDERAKDLPELRTVASMLAAGWGGTGSVVGRSAASSALRHGGHADYSGIDYSLDIGHLDLDYPADLDAPVPALDLDFDNSPARQRQSGEASPSRFLSALARQCNDAPGQVVPQTLAEIPLSLLPNSVAELIQEFAAQGFDESTIIVSLLLALRDRLGYALAETLNEALEDALSRNEPNLEVMAKVEAAVGMPRRSSGAGYISHLDIV